MAPPPVASTKPRHCISSAMTCCSRSRNPRSPSSSKIRGMLAPVRSSITRSESLKASPSSLASSRPMVLLPAPIGPTRVRLRLRITSMVQANGLVGQNARCNENQQLRFIINHHVALEQTPNDGNITKKRNLIFAFETLIRKHSAQYNGFTIGHQNLGSNLVLIDRRHTIQCISKVNLILGYLDVHDNTVIGSNLWRHFQRQRCLFKGGAGRTTGAGLLIWNFFAFHDFRSFLV